MKNVIMEQSEKVVLIVGAGITGLTAACTLAEAGEKCLLLEREDAVGGDCRTYEIDDILFDLGPHVLMLNPDAGPDAFLLEVMDKKETISKELCVAFFSKGRYWRFPPGLPDIASYPLLYLKEMISVRIGTGNKSTSHPDSVRALLEGKTGRSFYNDLFSSFILKKTGMPGDKLHRDWFLRADRDLEAAAVRPGKKRLLKSWYYPSGGFGTIPEKLLKKYTQAGGKTILGCGKISFGKEKYHITDAVVNGIRYPVRDVIWTASLNELNSIIGADVPAVSYMDTLIACLTYKRDRRVPRRFLYVYYPQDDVVFNRIYYPEHIFGNSIPPDREGLCLEINKFGHFKDMSDVEIVLKAIADIEDLGIYKKSELRRQKLFRLKECMPVYGLAYRQEVQDAFRSVKGFRNLHSVGRKGGFFFCQTPAAVGQGLKAARQLLEGRSKKHNRHV